MRKVYDENGGKATADSAFCSNDDYPFIIKSSPNPTLAEGETRARRHEMVAMQIAATSMRQSAEWGMRAVQSSFPRLKDRFNYEERGERKRVLMSIFLLYNLRTRLVGINQILNVYMPHLNKNANAL